MKKRTDFSRMVAIVCALLMVINAIGIQVYARTKEKTTSYSKLTFSDFGIADGTYGAKNGVYKNGASLIGSEITGYLKFNNNLTSVSNAAWLVFGTEGGWEGIQFKFQNNGTEVHMNTGSVTDDSAYNYVFDVSNIDGITTFAGTKFKFTLKLEEADLDGSGSKNDVIAQLYVNDKLCIANQSWDSSKNSTYGADGSYYILNAKKDKLKGYFTTQQTGATDLCKDILIESYKIQKITMSDFGITDGTYTSKSGVYNEGAILLNSEITGYLKFNNNLTSVSNAAWLVFGTEGGWEGIQFKFQNNGTEVHMNTGSVTDDSAYNYVFDVSNIDGITTFAGTKFKFTLKLETADLDGTGSDNDVIVQLYVNDKLCIANQSWDSSKNSTYGADGSYYILNAKKDKLKGYFTTQLIGGTGNCEDITFESTPITKVTFADFGITDGTYTSKTGVYKEGASLINTEISGQLELNENLKDVSNAAWLVFGTEGGWEGIQFKFQNNGTEVHMNTGSVTGDSAYNYVFDVANIDGITTFAGTKFKFTLRLEAADLDAGGLDNDVIARFYVNDKLCVANQSWDSSKNSTYGADGTYYILNANSDKLKGYFATQQVGGADCCKDITFGAVIQKPEGGNSTEKEEVSKLTGYTVLTFTDFGFDKVTTIKAEEVQKSAGDGGLHNVLIDGTYKFSKGGNYVYFGGTWKGIRLFVNSVGNMEIIHVSDDTSVVTEVGSITQEEAGFTLYERNISIKTAFQFTDVTETTATLTVILQLNNSFQKTLTIRNVELATMRRTLFLYSATSDKPLTLTANTISMIPSKKLKDITLEDFSINTSAVTETVYGAYKGASLDGTRFTTYITFPNNPSDDAQAYLRYGGADAAGWTGFSIQTTVVAQNDMLMIDCGNEQAKPIYIDHEIAKTRFYDTKVKLSITTEFVDADKDGAKDDVLLGIYFNDVLYDGEGIILLNRANSFGKNLLLHTNDAKYPIYLKTVKKEQVPTVDLSFKKITFDSYEIETGTYGYNKNDLSVFGHCKLESMDKVVFSDKIRFSKEAGAQLRIAGGETAWHGLVWTSTEEGTLRLTDALGILPALTFDSVTAGVQLVGNTVDWTLSFEYVDHDGDGHKDDVKLGVWFNGVAYNGSWIYLDDYAKYLGGYIGIYCPNKATTISLETYLHPIEFKIWGFTSRWLYELGLISA